MRYPTGRVVPERVRFERRSWDTSPVDTFVGVCEFSVSGKFTTGNVCEPPPPPPGPLTGVVEITGGCGSMTVIVTIIGPVVAIPSVTVYVNVSEPTYPSAGV
jgi:hypothetical protein